METRADSVEYRRKLREAIEVADTDLQKKETELSDAKTLLKRLEKAHYFSRSSESDPQLSKACDCRAQLSLDLNQGSIGTCERRDFKMLEDRIPESSWFVQPETDPVKAREVCTIFHNAADDPTMDLSESCRRAAFICHKAHNAGNLKQEITDQTIVIHRVERERAVARALVGKLNRMLTKGPSKKKVQRKAQKKSVRPAMAHTRKRAPIRRAPASSNGADRFSRR